MNRVSSLPVPNRSFTVLTLAVCSLILAPTLAYRMAVDHGVFAYIGAQILKGRLPYIHTWESDYPGLMFMQAAEIFFFGKSIYMFRLFDCIFQLGNAYLIYRIAFRVGAKQGAALLSAALYCLIYAGYGPWNTAQREGFGLFFILLGIWLFLTAERRRMLVTALAIGLGFGIAMLIKPTLLALAAFYFPMLGALKRRRAWEQLATAIVGCMIPITALLAYYWMRGGLWDLYEACVLYQPIYTARLRGDASLWMYWLSKLRGLGGNAVGLTVVSAPFLIWGEARRERFMLYSAYVGSVFAVFVQGTFAGYHYLPGLGIGSILMGTMFSQVTQLVLGERVLQIRRWSIKLSECAVLAILLIAPVFYVKPNYVHSLVTLHFLERPKPNEYRNASVFDFTEDFEVAEYLRAHTTPAEPVQVWGYESLVYYLADREAASRFQMTHPLVMRVPGRDITPMQQRWREEFMNDMEVRQPKYVAVVRDDNWWWAPEEKTSEQLLEDFPEWKALIRNRYTLEHTVGRFLIYRHSANTSDPRPLTQENRSQ